MLPFTILLYYSTIITYLLYYTNKHKLTDLEKNENDEIKEYIGFGFVRYQMYRLVSRHRQLIREWPCSFEIIRGLRSDRAGEPFSSKKSVFNTNCSYLCLGSNFKSAVDINFNSNSSSNNLIMRNRTLSHSKPNFILNSKLQLRL